MSALRTLRLAMVCISCAATSAVSIAAEPMIAIVGARVVTMGEAGTIENATILIRDGRIAALGSNIAVPAAARIFDAQGRIVTPGLMNAGTQMGIVEMHYGAADQSTSQGGFGAGFDIQHAFNANSVVYDVARGDGLARAVVLPGGSAKPPFNGMGALLRLTTDTAMLDRARAGVFVTVGGLSAVSVGGSRGAQWLLLRSALDDARRCEGNARACRREEESLDSSERLNRQAMIEVAQRRIPLVVSASRESDIRQAVRLADDYSIRVILYGAAEAWRVADLLALKGIPVVLDPFLNSPSTFDEIGARSDNAALLHRAGVRIAFAVPGNQSTHNAGTLVREAAGTAAANGLPWEEALKAITIAPARIWAIDDRYGSISVGKEADLVLWDGDPLQPASTPLAVWIAGDRVTLNSRQGELARRYLPAHTSWPAAYGPQQGANHAE